MAYDWNEGRIWATTHSGFIRHAFDSDGRALCNRNIRPREYARWNGEFFTLAEAHGGHDVHERCKQMLERRVEGDRLAAASPLAAAAAHVAEVVEATDAEQDEGHTRTDVEGIAEVMAGADDAAVNVLYDRLTERLGHEEASRRWKAASIQVDHEAAIYQTLVDLTEALAAAEGTARHAQQTVARLTAGDAWHPDYGESTTGEDINHHLQDALRSLRAADALHRAADRRGGIRRRGC